MRNLLLSAASAALILTIPVAAAPIATDLGAITNTTVPYATPDRTVAFSSGLSANQVVWFTFTFAGTSGTSFYLDIDTTTPNMTPATASSVDTELGLYDNAGNLIANDDDGGQDVYSLLTFGTTSPVRTYNVGGGIPALPTGGNGAHGTLPAGTYWLAIGRFDTTFGATNWDVVNTAGADTDAFDLNFRTDLGALGPVPEPSTYALFASGLAALLLRRRK
ncbi:MAG: PEP-CTERM sorting domain-containing protein [Bryobacteraceae bacterium]